MLLRRDTLRSPEKRRTKTGGGGIRTPVPRCFKTSIYMFSRFIIFFALLSAKRQAHNLAISGLNLASPARTTGSASLLVYALAGPTGKVRQDGLLN